MDEIACPADGRARGSGTRSSAEMVLSVDEICEELEVDVCLARLQLIAARRRLRQQDTAENCTAVVECRARLDVVLELLLELKGLELEGPEKIGLELKDAVQASVG